MGSIVISGIVRVTSDAEIRKSTNGAFYSFGVAAYRKYFKEGKQDVDFFDAVIYSKNPTPALAANLTKGKLMFIEGGNLLNEKYITSDGQERSKIKLKVLSYEFFNPAEKETPKEVVKEVPKVVAKPIKKEIIPDDDEPSDDEEAPF